VAIGHSRYSTTGASTWQNAQPTFRPSSEGSIALGHNGNIVNTHELRDMVDLLPGPVDELELQHRTGAPLSTNDTSLLTELLAHHPDQSLEERAVEVLPSVRGAFCLVWMDEDTLYAARDPHGIRPLVLGRLDRGWVVASEDAALATIGASVVREIEPGELIVINSDGLRSRRFAEPERKGCVFEYVYLARPDAVIAGRGVHEARVEMGRQLAREFRPRVGHARRHGVRRGERHPVRPGLRQELLRGPHLHPALADAAPARHPAQAQRARAHDPRQADRRGRRLDRARQHPARPGADAA
jgi:amidophosphoribosyltransferase